MAKNMVQWRFPENFLVGSKTTESSSRIQFTIFSINHIVHDYVYVLGNLGPWSVPSVISGFHREVDENSALLGYCAASSGNLLPTFRDSLSVPSWRVKLKTGPTGCPETSVMIYLYTLHNIPEERRCLYKLEIFLYCCLCLVFTGTFARKKLSFLDYLT